MCQPLIRCLIHRICEYYDDEAGKLTKRDFYASNSAIEDAIYNIFDNARKSDKEYTNEEMKFPKIGPFSSMSDVDDFQTSLTDTITLYIKNHYLHYCEDSLLDDQYNAHRVLLFYSKSKDFEKIYICRRALSDVFEQEDEDVKEEAVKFVNQFRAYSDEEYMEIVHAVNTFLRDRISSARPYDFVDAYSKIMLEILPTVYRNAPSRANLPIINSKEASNLSLTDLANILRVAVMQSFHLIHFFAGIPKYEEIRENVEETYKHKTNVELYFGLMDDLKHFGECNGCDKTLTEMHGWSQREENFQKIGCLILHLGRAKDFKDDKPLYNILLNGVINSNEELSDDDYNLIHRNAIKYLEKFPKPVIKESESSSSNENIEKISGKDDVYCPVCHYIECKGDKTSCKGSWETRYKLSKENLMQIPKNDHGGAKRKRRSSTGEEWYKENKPNFPDDSNKSNKSNSDQREEESKPKNPPSAWLIVTGSPVHVTSDRTLLKNIRPVGNDYTSDGIKYTREFSLMGDVIIHKTKGGYGYIHNVYLGDKGYGNIFSPVYNNRNKDKNGNLDILFIRGEEAYCNNGVVSGYSTTQFNCWTEGTLQYFEVPSFEP